MSCEAAAILLAGGSSHRFSGGSEDKLLMDILGKPTVQYSLDAFAASGCVTQIVIVYRDATQETLLEAALDLPQDIAIAWTQGGVQRQDSVWHGLQAVEEQSSIVLIHDCARPLVTPSAIKRVAQAANEHQAACLARPVTDTLKQAEEEGKGYRLSTVDRSTLWAMETPQAFSFDLIKQAYQKVIASGQSITDDLSAIEAHRLPVKFIANDGPNPKLTMPSDIPFIEHLLSLAPTS